MISSKECAYHYHFSRFLDNYTAKINDESTSHQYYWNHGTRAQFRISAQNHQEQIHFRELSVFQFDLNISVHMGVQCCPPSSRLNVPTISASPSGV